MKSRLVPVFLHSVAVLCALCLSYLTGIAEDRPSPDQLIQIADGLTDLSKIQPYKLTATVVLRPGKKNEMRGQLVINRDHDRYRSELQIGNERETRVRLRDKLYIARTSQTAFFGLNQLNNLEGIWRQRPSGPETVKLGRVSRKKINGTESFCFRVQQPPYVAKKSCVNAATHLPVEGGDTDQKYEFSDYQTVSQQQYPGTIRMAKAGQWILEVRDIRVTQQTPEASIFSAPPGAEELDTCDDMRDAKPLEHTDLLTSQVYRSVSIYLTGIVEKDGTFHPVEVVTVPPDPELTELVRTNAAKRRYSPAMCGSKPVTTENQIEIQVDRH